MITALLSLSLLAAAPVAPDPTVGAPRVRVGYGDLDLNSAAGRAELDRRLAYAVNRVCPSPDIRQMSKFKADEECRAAATAMANSQRDAALASARADIVQIGSSGR